MQAGSGWCFLNGVAVCSRALAAPAHLAGFNVPSTIIYMSLLCLFFTAVVLCRGAVFFLSLPPLSQTLSGFIFCLFSFVFFLFVFPCHPCFFTVPLLFSRSLFTLLHVKLHLENSMMFYHVFWTYTIVILCFSLTYTIVILLYPLRYVWVFSKYHGI